MKRVVGTWALLIGLSGCLLGAVPTQASTQISSCPFTISAPGSYVVTKDLACSGTAITITTIKVDLDLGGHTLSGSGVGSGAEVQLGANINIHHGTVNGFADGIFLNGGLSCTVSNVAANGNSHAGIYLLGANANAVAGNTITQTGDRGISVFLSSGNTIMRNTVDRNILGISVSDYSTGNTVARNTCTQNGDGIRLWVWPTQNTIQDNTCIGNGSGINLLANSNQNTMQGNTTSLNTVGIWIQQDCTGNRIQGNTALTNRSVDVEDDNPGCDSNHWLNNRFLTFSVAGGPDGGCLLGQPNSAQLSVTAGGTPSNLAPGDCVTLALKVRFAGRSDYIDVTAWSPTSFSAPGHGVVSGNQLCVGPRDANTTFTVYGRYTDPVSGVSTTATSSVHVHQ